jgi:sigma-B regulation protein RsbU (phosphoserine phosphatase)
MDSIFYLGDRDEKLPKLLEKLGYAVVQRDPEMPLADLVARTNLDLILIDSRLDPDSADLCTFFRTQESTRGLPIIFIREPSDTSFNAMEELDRVEVVDSPVAIGALAGRIATQLRLRKFAGRDELKSTLAEVNATLRDYNARFRKELEEARAIQQSLLPRTLPSDSRFQMAVSYQPLEEVGGDWYFASKTEDGRIACQIADVTGHGLSAAFIGSMTKLAMSAAGKQRPDELLAGMNRLMAPQIPAGRFVTMGSCLYDPATGALEWARAGHPPGMLYHRATGEVEQLMGDGFAVGFFEDSEYSLVNAVLEPGDALLLFTDGISEAQNRSMETYGLERLASALKEAPVNGNPASILEHILDEFDAFRQERILKDDVTVMLLKRTA